MIKARNIQQLFPAIGRTLHILLFPIFFLLTANNASAQSCTPDIFFHRYNGNAAIYVSKAITTVQNETVIAGGTLNFSPIYNDATDGWVCKLSSRGTVLWAKRYYLPNFTSGRFLSIENATDSTYLVTARFARYIKRNNGAPEEVDAATYVMHLDKFGNLIWLKRMTNFINNSFMNGITRINNNAFIITGNVYSNGTNRLLVLRTDLSGNVAWYKVLRQDSTQLLSATTKLLNNGDFLLTGPTLRTQDGSPLFNLGYFFLKLDPINGSITANKAVYINEGPSPNYGVNNIDAIAEVANDTLYMYTSFSERQLFFPVPSSREAAILKISTNGAFYAATGFYNAVPGCQLLDGKYNGNGSHTLLMDDGYKTILAEVNNNGTVGNQFSYPLVNGNMKGLKLLDGTPNNRILFAGRTQVPLLGMMKTEPNGSISCMDGPSQMTGFDISSFFTTATMQVTEFLTNPVFLEEIGGGIGTKVYNLDRNTDCLQTCCDNIPANTTITELCNATQFKLPDNSVVRQSGIYYTSHITANNCDSIAYHDVRFLEKPVVNLGQDICFGDSTRLTLRTDSGYAQYNWMGTLTPAHTYNITVPGVYTVSVTNKCGISTDEIEAFKECDFPVDIPSAFTPNNDGLNDMFIYPPLNKNRFVSMSVYNRWGQQVFYSANVALGWDGTFKNNPQPNDVYIYFIHVRTLDGKPLMRKGTITIIR